LTRENFLFAIIGVLLGFILGFMLHGVMSQRDAERAAASTEQRQQLPSDHPPIDNAGSGNPQQTMEQVQETIARARNNPKDFDAQIMAARLEYQIQQYDEAIKFLLTANQLKPDNYDVLVMLGEANMDAQHWDAAEKWYKAAQTKNSKDVAVAASLAFVSLQRGDVKAAERAIANLEKLSPDSPDLQNFKKRLDELKSGQSK
jgi:cytochrome c-type biogenesis protein CcmH/NrfG